MKNATKPTASVTNVCRKLELRKLINSTRPEDQVLKKRIPKEIITRVLTGRNIQLNQEEVTHIARRSNPYDVRGTSMLKKIFR